MSMRDAIEMAADEINPEYGQAMRAALDDYAAEVRRTALEVTATVLTEMDDAVSFNDAFNWGYGLRKGIDKIREMIEKGN